METRERSNNLHIQEVSDYSSSVVIEKISKGKDNKYCYINIKNVDMDIITLKM